MRKEWHLRGRLVAIVALSATAPTIAIAYWVVAWLTSGMPLAIAIAAVIVWIGAVAGAAIVFGRFAAGRLVGPLEELTAALYRFDPVAGNIGIEALAERPDEPFETAAFKRALRSGVERIVRDRAQRDAVMAGLMHDLKTPLVAQSLLVDQLKRDGADCPVRHHEVLVQLERSSHGALVRLNRLVDVLRVDASAVNEIPSHVDVRKLVDDALVDLQPLLAARSVDVAVTGTWSAHLARDTAMRAIENVVANAVRHARSVVRVAVHPGLVEVSDDGPGFNVPFDEAVDPFRPGPVTHDRPSGTAGLGLYIARRSLEALGGHLTLALSSERGSTLLLYLGTGSA